MIDKIKTELLTARKNRDKLAVNVLGLVLGEIQTASVAKDLTEQDELSIIKKIIKSNNTTIKALKESGTDFQELEQENEILNQFLPQQLTCEQIEKIIAEHGITLDSNVGKSMGMAIKVLKKEGHEFDANDVREAIQKLLSA